MRRKSKHGRQTLRDIPFFELVTRNPDLSEARRKYAGDPPEKRRAAAQWEYDSSIAGDLFSGALRRAGVDDESGSHKETDPKVAEHWSGLSYCFGKMGEMDEAIATARKAHALDDKDPYVLNDLGWTLTLAGLYKEARVVLQRAVASAPPDYVLPQNNLKELEKLARRQLASKQERS